MRVVSCCVLYGVATTGTEISAALVTAGFPLSPQAQAGVLGRFDPRHAGLTLDGFTEVALFLGGLKSYFDFYAFSAASAPPAHQQPGAPGVVQPPMPGSPGAQPAASNISINFDQLVAATPYFM